MSANRDVHQRRPVTGGYEAVFRPELDKKYMCPICLGAMRDAMQTPCGHRFCKNCIYEVANGYNGEQIKCPVDNFWFSHVDELFADNAVRREILSLAVTCNNESHGCKWSGELRDIEEHQKCCDFVAISCENGCTDLVLRKNLPDHQISCSNRPSTCGHCGKSVLYVDLTRHEVLECAMFPVRCTLCGQWGIKRQDIQRHLDKEAGDCPQGMVACPYQKYGCQFQDKRQNMSNHEKDCADVHLVYVESKVTSQEQQITTLNKKFDELSGMLERSLSQYEILLREVIDAQSTSYTGALMWKISLVSDQDKYTSKSFYTGCPGYKLLVSLEFGYMDQGTVYASLFVTLEVGQFDEELYFPFNAVCDVSVIAQNQTTSNFKQTVVCRNVPRCRVERLNLASQRGVLKFMPVEELKGETYCKEESIFLQIRVRNDYD